MRTKSKFLPILLTLAMLEGFLPWATLPVRATNVNSGSTDWEETMSVKANVTIESDVTLKGNATLSIYTGKELIVNGTIDCNGHTLTVSGGGLTVTGGAGGAGASSPATISAAPVFSGRKMAGIQKIQVNR